MSLSDIFMPAESLRNDLYLALLFQNMYIKRNNLIYFNYLSVS